MRLEGQNKWKWVVLFSALVFAIGAGCTTSGDDEEASARLVGADAKFDGSSLGAAFLCQVTPGDSADFVRVDTVRCERPESPLFEERTFEVLSEDGHSIGAGAASEGPVVVRVRSEHYPLTVVSEGHGDYRSLIHNAGHNNVSIVNLGTLDAGGHVAIMVEGRSGGKCGINGGLIFSCGTLCSGGDAVWIVELAVERPRLPVGLGGGPGPPLIGQPIAPSAGQPRQQAEHSRLPQQPRRVVQP